MIVDLYFHIISVIIHGGNDQLFIRFSRRKRIILFGLIIFYKKDPCQNSWPICVTIAPSGTRKITVLSVVVGWEVVRLRLFFVVTALLEIRKITVPNVVNGWEVIKRLLMFAIIVGSEIRRVIVSNVINGFLDVSIKTKFINCF